MSKLVALLISVAVVAVACSSDPPRPYAGEVNDYWATFDVDEKTAFCMGMDQAGSGFKLIGFIKEANEDSSGQIDLLRGGMVEDTHETRLAVGVQFDRIASENCR